MATGRDPEVEAEEVTKHETVKGLCDVKVCAAMNPP